MSETQRSNKTITLVVVAVAVGLLLSLVAGALAGGAAGFLIGRQQGRLAAERAVGEMAPQAQLPFRLQEVLPQVPEGQDVPEVLPNVPRIFGASVDGALVSQVVEGTPAEEAGLQPGDVIVAVDGRSVAEVEDLRELLQDYKPDDRVELAVWSEDAETVVLVRLAEHPDQPGRAYLGIYYTMVGMGRGPMRPQD